MSVVKEEQHALEAKIHLLSPEPGVQAIREWLMSAREVLNTNWPRLTGDGLLQAQGYAGNLNDLIRIIDKGPKLPRQEPIKQQGGNNG